MVKDLQRGVSFTARATAYMGYKRCHYFLPVRPEPIREDEQVTCT